MARSVSSRNQDALRQADVDLLDTAMRQLRIRTRVELPPIVDFVEHSSFLSMDRLYPRQKTLLRLMCLETENMTAYDVDVINEWADGFWRANGEQMGVVPDVWKRIEMLKERGYQQFREVVNISGRRGSKGHLGGIMGARQNWRLIQASDPQLYYGILRGKELYCYVTATTKAQAQAYQFADLARTLLGAPCFQPYIFEAKPTFITIQTDADRMRAAELERQGVVLDRPIASIINVALSANSAAARGGAAFCAIFDEMAHMIIGTAGPRTAEAVYKAITPSLGQVAPDDFIYIPTSPLTKVGQAYSLASHALEQTETGEPAYPTMLLVQLPSWFAYEDWNDPVVCQGHTFTNAPEKYDLESREEERRDPETFRVEKKAQWAEVVDAYLPPDLVDRLFIPLPTADGVRITTKQEYGVLKWIYRGHADPAESGDNFAMAICHAEPIEDAEGEVWSHVFLDWLQVWKPSDFEDGLIDYATVEEEIAEAIQRFPALNVFSYDQFGSFVTVPQLRTRLHKAGKNITVKKVAFTAENNRKRFEDFRAAMGMNWIHAYRDSYGPEGASLLELELKFLQRVNNRIDHQKIGPVKTKDAVDAFMVAATELLGDQLERLRKRRTLGETPLIAGAKGGYHTDPEAEALANMSLARQRLIANSQASKSRTRRHGGY